MSLEVPFELRIWGVAECAEYLGYEPRYFRDRIRYQEGFPAPLDRLQLRWKAADVTAWALKKTTPESRPQAANA